MFNYVLVGLFLIVSGSLEACRFCSCGHKSNSTVHSPASTAAVTPMATRTESPVCHPEELPADPARFAAVILPKSASGEAKFSGRSVLKRTDTVEEFLNYLKENQ